MPGPAIGTLLAPGLTAAGAEVKAVRTPPEPSVRRVRMADGCEIAVHEVPATRHAVAQVVVLHGTAMHSKFYFAFARLLAARGLSVSLIDQRGHGASSGPEGQVDHPWQYADDLCHCLREQSSRNPDLPLFVLAHSGGNAIALKAFPRLGIALAGLALLTPTLAHDPQMMRRRHPSKSAWVRVRHGVRVRQPRAVSDDGKELMKFYFFPFVLSRLLGVGRRRPALVCDAPDPRKPVYVYSCDAAAGSMLESTGDALAHVNCPLLLATGENDYWVNDAAVHHSFPWMVRPGVPYRAHSYSGANHYTTLYQVIRDLDDWIQCTLHPTSIA